MKVHKQDNKSESASEDAVSSAQSLMECPMTPAAYVKSLCKRTDYDTMIDEVLKTYEPQKDVARERKRFSPETRNILLHELRKNPDWSRHFRAELAQRFGLNKIQLYKWYWDRKRLLEKDPEAALC